MGVHFGTCKVTLNGTEKELRFGYRALARLEELEGRAVPSLFKDEETITSMMGIRFISHALHAGLMWAGGGKLHSVSRVQDEMQPAEMAGYVESITRALTYAMTGKAPEDLEQAQESTKPADPTIAAIGTGINTSSAPYPSASPSISSGS